MKVEETTYICCKVDLEGFILSRLSGKAFYLFAVWVNGSTVLVSYLPLTEIIQLPVQSEKATVVISLTVQIIGWPAHPYLPFFRSSHKQNENKQPPACFAYTPLFRNHCPFDYRRGYKPLINHLKSAMNDSPHVPQIWHSELPNMQMWSHY